MYHKYSQHRIHYLLVFSSNTQTFFFNFEFADLEKKSFSTIFKFTTVIKQSFVVTQQTHTTWLQQCEFE